MHCPSFQAVHCQKPCSFHTQGLTPAPSFILSCSCFNCVKANNHSKWRQNHPSVQILLPSPRPGDFKRSFTIYNCNILLLFKNISLGMAATFFILTISHGEMLATKKENFNTLDFQTYIDSCRYCVLSVILIQIGNHFTTDQDAKPQKTKSKVSFEVHYYNRMPLISIQ